MMVLVDVHQVVLGEGSEVLHLHVVLPEQFLHEAAALVQTAVALLLTL